MLLDKDNLFVSEDELILFHQNKIDALYNNLLQVDDPFIYFICNGCISFILLDKKLSNIDLNKRTCSSCYQPNIHLTLIIKLKKSKYFDSWIKWSHI